MKVRALSLFACVGLCAAANAQTLNPEARGPIYRIDHSGHILGEMSPFEARAVGFAFRNNTFDSPTGGTSVSATHRCDLEDVSFASGPWSTEATHSFSRVQFSLRRNLAVPVPASGVFIVYRIWDSASVNFNGQSGNGSTMIATGATPLAQLTVQLPVVNQDVIAGFVPVDFAPISFTPTNNSVFVEAKLITDPNNDILLNVDCWRLVLTTGSAAAAPGNPATIGVTGPTVAVDGVSAPNFPLDGIFQGGSPTGAPFENRNFTFTTTPAQTVGLDFAMGGELPAVAPPCQGLTLGADNVFVSDTQNSTATGVKWYCFALPGDVTDESLKYLDVDTEGSTTDAAVAVFKDDGTLVAFDDNSGSGNNAMLTFGIGRRAATGDGLQYDGRNFDGSGAASIHGLGAGNYFIAVTPSGSGDGARFNDAFGATGSGTAGNITLRVRTNVAGGALEPSVPPVAARIVGVSNEDPIVSPGGQLPALVLNGPGVYWSDVQLCQGADAANPVQFQTDGTDAPAFSISVFDSNGNLVGQGAGAPGTPPQVIFGGANPARPAGHYYVAMAYDSPSPDLAPSPDTNGRWHVRGENGSQGFNFVISVLVPWAACGSNACCLSDFNGDGDVATDADIEAFFACLGGNCCATCPADADFNCDGDVATDADIESFFRVLAGGAC